MNLQADELQALLQEPLKEQGFLLWGVEVLSGHYPLLRIYIDMEQGVINIGQVGQASQQIIDSLRLAGVNTEHVLLEVSSPGFNRRLFRLEQCEAYVGQMIAVKLRQSVDGRQRYKGILVAIQDEQLVIAPPDLDEPVLCPWNWVIKANVVADLRTYLTSEKKGKRQ